MYTYGCNVKHALIVTQIYSKQKIVIAVRPRAYTHYNCAQLVEFARTRTWDPHAANK